MCAPRDPSALREAPSRAPVVHDVRVAVHGPADTVPAELQVDPEPRRPGHLADRERDVAEPVADPGRLDAGRQRTAGDLDQPQVLLPRRAHDQAQRGVRHPAVHGRREVDAEQVTVAQGVVARQAVQHRVVDRRAQHLPERRGTERRVVVEVAGLGAALTDHPVRQRVEVEQVHPDVGGVLEGGKDVGDEAAGGTHLLDLGGGPELDHAASLRPGTERLAVASGRPRR
jgi:hypothetical protein